MQLQRIFRFLTCVAVMVVMAGGLPVHGQTWDPNKVWYAGDPGSPNTLRYVDVDGSFPGWTQDDPAGSITHQAPSINPGGISGLEGSFFKVTNGKQKHRTTNWTFDNAASTRTALFWRIYIPSDLSYDKMPSIQIRHPAGRHYLDFEPDASGGANPKSGWVTGQSTSIGSGGLIKNDGSGERYLPMTMDAWHTIRVEAGPGGLTAWMDEEEGLSDVKRIEASSDTDSGGYIEIGVRSTISGVAQFWTNYLAWGQDTTASGGANQIAPLMSPTALIEICTNGVDDDNDGLADCADPGCLCAPVPEDNFTACHNGVDDDQDGLVDCDDPDCAGAAAENTFDACTNNIDDDCDGLVDCEDPDCAATAAENTLDACRNARDDDCDGLVDCLDPDCTILSECDSEAPHYELTLVRQVGEWQNSCSTFACNSVLYASVYDEQGNPLDGVFVGDPVRGVGMTTMKDPGQGPDGQSGHGRYDPLQPLDGAYRLRVISENGSAVSSDATPFLFATPDASPSGRPQYTWQVEFMRKEKRRNAGTFTPQDPCYIFDGVELNPAAGVNPTLDDDFSDFFTGGGDGFVQTFVADGNRVISGRFELSIGFLQVFRYQVSIHPLLNDPPTSLADLGPQIGATRMGPANMIDSEWWTQMLNWPIDKNNAAAVVVTPGTKYAALIKRADPTGTNYPGINAFLSNGNWFPDGQAYRQPYGMTTLVSDSSNYDVTGYIVCADVPKCANDPRFDVVGGGTLGDLPDGQVDGQDFDVFRQCATGPTPDPSLFDEEHASYIGDLCSCLDVTGDLAIDQSDFAVFQRCLGLSGSALADCDD